MADLKQTITSFIAGTVVGVGGTSIVSAQNKPVTPPGLECRMLGPVSNPQWVCRVPPKPGPVKTPSK